ncbi:hypothetical protein [Lysinibacillus sphaericus]|uniref:hypothetical protein n=1 Tax=Lysinibacillus sphaericus TaxID=1421 RepID=UPI0019D65924|nr:hypothetical protein [Lysinibacillus sphaericus]
MTDRIAKEVDRTLELTARIAKEADRTPKVTDRTAKVTDRTPNEDGPLKAVPLKNAAQACVLRSFLYSNKCS